MPLQHLPKALWAKLEEFAYHVFYRKPIQTFRHRGLEHRHIDTIRLYGFAILFFYFFLHWIVLFLWYLTVQAATYHLTRPMVGAVDFQPFTLPRSDPDWFRKLWHTHTDPKQSFSLPSPIFETIATSHLILYDIEDALSQQVSKLTNPHLNMFQTDELLESLDKTLPIISDCAAQAQNFARTFCMEKDIMTYALRNFVEVYVILTHTGHRPFIWQTVFFCPGFPVLGLLNRSAWLSWLPKPQIYTFEVVAENRFQRRRLFRQISIALDHIDAKSPAAWKSLQSRHSISQTHFLDTAFNAVTAYQTQLKQAIESSGYWPLRWLYKDKRTASLERYNKLSERICRRLLAVKESANVYALASRRIRNELRPFGEILDNDFEFEAPPTNLSGVSPSLVAHIQDITSPAGVLNLKANENKDTGYFTKVALNSYLHLNDLDSLDESIRTALPSVIKHVCNNPSNYEIVSSDLHMICMIHDLEVAMSGPGDDPLATVMRSWTVARREAIARYEQQNELDQKSLIRILLQSDQDNENGRPLPHE